MPKVSIVTWTNFIIWKIHQRYSHASEKSGPFTKSEKNGPFTESERSGPKNKETNDLEKRHIQIIVCNKPGLKSIHEYATKQITS